ncbi:hypothetical protein, partial [Streptomyces sp. NPDC054804]
MDLGGEAGALQPITPDKNLHIRATLSDNRKCKFPNNCHAFEGLISGDLDSPSISVAVQRFLRNMQRPDPGSRAILQ